MRAKGTNLDGVKNEIAGLVGQRAKIVVCRGRNKVKIFEGIIENAFPSVFKVNLLVGDFVVPTVSYSYNDVLCGEVKVSLAINEARAI
ncbi:MAG: Veg family protein [Christensenellaceae bacterium]|jgi:uncharacterized protein Veg|nr:Veg family protein [Christensenellaceae bacterium]